MKRMEAIQASFDCSDLGKPMGEARKDALRLNFARKLKLEFHGTLTMQDIFGSITDAEECGLCILTG
jgi:hypothetical protein